MTKIFRCALLLLFGTSDPCPAHADVIADVAMYRALSQAPHTADDQILVQILLDAAVMYDQQCATQPDLQLPPLVIVITGKGPNKQTYREIMRVMTLPHVAICTAWVDASDYAALLACADLGVSLHVSSSGLDLPMKVSDMLGWCAPHAVRRAGNH
jgi:hypothetical protein